MAAIIGSVVTLSAKCRERQCYGEWPAACAASSGLWHLRGIFVVLPCYCWCWPACPAQQRWRAFLLQLRCLRPQLVCLPWRLFQPPQPCVEVRACARRVPAPTVTQTSSATENLPVTSSIRTTLTLTLRLSSAFAAQPRPARPLMREALQVGQIANGRCHKTTLRKLYFRQRRRG